MRQPLHMTFKLGQYLVGKKLSGERHYPIVLMLEPLHTCNLACIGCTSDRWAGPKSEWLTLAQCLEAVDECGAPIVSICGGEPLVYPELPELVREINRRGKYTIVCTNALLMDRYLRKQKPNRFQSFAVHIDGPEEVHDRITKHPGCFDKAVEAARRAKREGYRVTTNTTIFAETDVAEWTGLVTETDWAKYGPESDDARCKNCMVHCGFEPTVATGRGVPIRSQMRNAVLSLV